MFTNVALALVCVCRYTLADWFRPAAVPLHYLNDEGDGLSYHPQPTDQAVDLARQDMWTPSFPAQAPRSMVLSCAHPAFYRPMEKEMLDEEREVTV